MSSRRLSLANPEVINKEAFWVMFSTTTVSSSSNLKFKNLSLVHNGREVSIASPIVEIYDAGSSFFGKKLFTGLNNFLGLIPYGSYSTSPLKAPSASQVEDLEKIHESVGKRISGSYTC